MSFEFGDRLHSFLSNNPHRCDVVFAVGPQKKIVRTMRFILVIADPIFEKIFQKSWDHFIAKKKPIPLKDFDPDAFKLFIKLMVKNNVTTLKLQKMRLPLESVFNLMEICDRYGPSKLYEKLFAISEKAVFQNLPEFVQTQEFYNLSLKNVKLVLSRKNSAKDECEVDIFEVTWKWSKSECQRRGKPPTLDNVRKVFDASLPEVLKSGAVEAKQVGLEIRIPTIPKVNLPGAQKNPINRGASRLSNSSPVAELIRTSPSPTQSRRINQPPKHQPLRPPPPRNFQCALGKVQQRQREPQAWNDLEMSIGSRIPRPNSSSRVPINSPEVKQKLSTNLRGKESLRSRLPKPKKVNELTPKYYLGLDQIKLGGRSGSFSTLNNTPRKSREISSFSQCALF